MLTNLRKICNHPSLCPPAALVPGEGSAGVAAAAAAAAATAAAVAAAAGEGGEEFDPDQSGGVGVQEQGQEQQQVLIPCLPACERCCFINHPPTVHDCSTGTTCTSAGKMAVLGVLLHESINVAGDRMVVVSQSTAALDLVQASQTAGWHQGWLRDGSLPAMMSCTLL